MTPKKRRGEILTVVLLAVAIIGGGLFMLKPKFLHGETKRAESSVVATQKVASTVAATDAAATKQAASAAAGVATIGIANGMAPDSPAKYFIAKEIPAVLDKLPPPDPQALLEAERRRSAVMEGRADEAARLYQLETKHSAELQKERDTALVLRDSAMQQRRAVDAKLVAVAEEHRAAEQRTAVVCAIAGLLGVGWLYTKLTHLSPTGLGNLATDIRNGFDPITALGIHTPPWVHAGVQRAVKLAATLEDTTPKATV